MIDGLVVAGKGSWNSHNIDTLAWTVSILPSLVLTTARDDGGQPGGVKVDWQVRGQMRTGVDRSRLTRIESLNAQS
jgi:hypothetical protein